MKRTYFFRRRSAWMAAHLLGSLWLGACNGSDRGPAPPADVATSADADPADDDPKETRVDVVGDREVTVTLEGLGAGKFQISIASVDGQKVFSTEQVERASKDADKPIEATLDLPEVGTQAELVAWNLRVSKESAGGDELVLNRSLLYALELEEVTLEGPARVTEDKQVAYRLKARHPLTKAPLEGRTVELEIRGEDDKAETLTGKTDDTGVAVLHVTPGKSGSYSVAARTKSKIASAQLADEIEVAANGDKVLLTTDKPVYKPGQTMHLRALALDAQGNTPSAGVKAVFEVEDGKGNKVFHKEFETDEYGIAATKFVIGSIVNEGNYKVRTVVGDVVSEKTVAVKQYALPKFRVDVETDRAWYAPGDVVSGEVDSKYFFGKAVAGGQVRIEVATLDVGENVYQEILGQTGADGSYKFSVATPETLVGLPLEQGLALLNLRVTVTDTAGQEVVKELPVRVAAAPLSLSVIPEGTQLIAGIENRLHVFVTDPLGSPVRSAKVELQTGEKALTVTTDAGGHAVAQWTPTSGAVRLTADVTAGEQQLANQVFDFNEQAGVEHVLVRTDKSVYDVGDVVSVEVLTTDDNGSIFVDWLNEGQAVDLRTLDPKEGSASFDFTLDSSLLGSNRVEAYIVQDDGNIVRAGRNLFVRSASNLSVALDTNKAQYQPGDAAKLTFTVTDEAGAPAAAALGVQIVDQAVFALVDARPGLLETYFQLEDEFREPHYQLKAPPGSLTGLLFSNPDSDEEAGVQAKSEAVLAALDGMRMTGLSGASWEGVLKEARATLAPFFDSERARLIQAANQQLNAVADGLVESGCDPNSYWCDALQTSLAEAFAARLSQQVKANDFWGNAYDVQPTVYPLLTLVTSGPDEQSGSTDDERLVINVADLDFTLAPAWGGPARGGEVALDQDGNGVPGPVPGGLAPPAADGEAVADLGGDDNSPEPSAGAGGASSEGQSEERGGPRVRQDFPETLYVNPSVITDGTGTATLEVEMADSITEWRVSTMANSAGGKLGSAAFGVTVFQDFFVDVNFPATLTRGDEIEFPIAIYNYLDEPQIVNVELEAADWYTALGESALSVELAPGEVRGVSVPVRVLEVGRQTLTVFGNGSEKSDAVARSVLVIPDGQQLATAQSGSVKGTVTQQVSFTADAIPGSEQLYLNVFPTFLSQAVEGMDSLLRTPNGCFEQTTSTAWPNVLVTDYMKKTDQVTPEILLRAESLMSAGYQRLLTFEHPGGGFSWFGTQDPAPFLSVTAFGLLEFSDMAKVHPVDEAMLARTLQYLLSQQAPDGSWSGDQSEFFSFHTSGLRNTAFTLWAIGSAGYSGPETERGLAYLKAQLNQSETDAYTLALVANAYALLAPSDPTLSSVIETLIEQMQLSGADDEMANWDTEGTQTNFYGSGSDAAVSATALVVHALLQVGGYGDAVAKGLTYLTAQKDPSGNFGSTQATIWTLKSLLLAAERGTSTALGSLVVEVDGETVQTVELTEATADVMRTLDLGHLATTGEHAVTLTFAGEGAPSFSLVSSQHVPWGVMPEPEPGPLSVAVDYDRSALSVDETVTASIRIQNNTASPQNMVLVTAGLPPGFEVERGDFDSYLQAGSLSRVEVTGKQIILYVTELAASAEQVFSYRLRATMPVRASDGGASVYPYYEPKKKSLSAAKELTVAAL